MKTSMKKRLISLLSIILIISLSACVPSDSETQAASYLSFSDVFGNTALDGEYYSSSSLLDEVGVFSQSKTYFSNNGLFQGALYVQSEDHILTKAMYTITYDIENLSDYSVLTISEFNIRFEELECEIDDIVLSFQGEEKQLALQMDEAYAPLNWVQRIESTDRIKSGIDIKLGVTVNGLPSTIILSL